MEAESDKLLAAHFADAIDLPTLKRHQDRIRAGLSDIDRRLAEHDQHHAGGSAFLHDSLRLLTDAHHAYARSDDGNRRLANQAFYTRLEVTEDDELRPTLAEPFATITATARGNETAHEHDASCDVACSRKDVWVETVLWFSNNSATWDVDFISLNKRVAKQQPRKDEPTVRTRARRLLSTGDKEQLIADYRAGASTAMLADNYRMSRTRIVGILRGSGVEIRYQALTSEQLDQCRALYRAGNSLATIGSKLGLNPSTVRNSFVAAGEPLRPRRGWT